MDDQKVGRLTGMFGLAATLFFLGQVPLYFGDPAPPIDDALAFTQHVANIRLVVLTRVLLNMGLYCTLMVFFAGFRHLIRQARPDYEWVATLVFMAGAVWLAVTLVANSMEGGEALHTLGRSSDPSVVQALVEGSLLIYNGAIAFAVTGLFLASAGWATLATAVLPKWTGWLACLGALLCLLVMPSMYAPVLNYRGFYNAAGLGPALVANVPPLIWFLSVSILLILKGRAAK